MYIYQCTIEIRDATIEVDSHVVCKDLSLMAMDGRLTCVHAQDTEALGVLLHAFLDLQPFESGHVSVDGERITPLSTPFFRQMMVYVPSKFEFGDISVFSFFHLLVDMEAPARHEQKTVLLKQWQLLGADKSCYGQQLCSLPSDVQQCVILSFVDVLDRNIILLNQPTVRQIPESVPLMLSHVQLTKADGHLVLRTTTDEQVAEMAGVVINLTP